MIDQRDPALPWRCVCGRGFEKCFGRNVHQRTCPVYRNRRVDPAAAATTTEGNTE